MQNGRYCEPFNMTRKEWIQYKDSKHTRWIWYIVGMVITSVFAYNWAFMGLLTLWIISDVIDKKKKEEQWIKDGALTREDLKD